MSDDVANELLKDVIREVTEYRKLPLSGSLQERLLAHSQLTPVTEDACPVCHEEYSGACGSRAVGFERG